MTDKGFKPGQIVIRQLSGGDGRNPPRWGIYVRDARSYSGGYGYVLLWSRNHPAFNETLSPSSHQNLVGLEQANSKQLAILPDNVYDLAQRTLEKQHPAIHKEIFPPKEASVSTDMNELKLVERFQESQRLLSLYRVLVVKGHDDIAREIAGGQVSFRRAELMFKRKEAEAEFYAASEKLSEASHRLTDIKQQILDLDVAEGRIQPLPPKHERAHDMLEVQIIDLPLENENGIIRRRQMAKYTCKCGFVGKATSGWNGEALGRKAWKNFYAHQHRQEVRAMREEKANAGS